MNPMMIAAGLGAGISTLSTIFDIKEQNEKVAALQANEETKKDVLDDERSRLDQITADKQADLKDQYQKTKGAQTVATAAGGASLNSATALALKSKMAADYGKYKTRIDQDAAYQHEKLDFQEGQLDFGIDMLERDKVNFWEGALLVGGSLLGGGAQGASTYQTYDQMGAFGG
jgi:hypothetical protein